MDIFDAKILCKKCGMEMKQKTIEKEGAQLRAVECPKCKDKIIHPADLNCLNDYRGLKGKPFAVKLRIVGNSHAISIPKELFDFMNEQRRLMSEQHKSLDHEMGEMVRLALESFGRLSLRFGEVYDSEEDEN
jgi:DNA-directed RNA polymerase subunit RPC12/RpoP